MLMKNVNINSGGMELVNIKGIDITVESTMPTIPNLPTTCLNLLI